MLPNFFCIGAQKSGTTTLWHLLEAHPEICMARPRETRFFAEPIKFAEGLAKYELTSFAHWNGERAVGEKCPEYLYEPQVPARLHAALGADLKFVVTLRSPAQRAFSHYRHNRAMLRECRTFEAAIAAELEAQASGMPVSAAFAYLGRGRYAHQLERYLRLFGLDRLLVVSFEAEVGGNQARLAHRLYEFLGVSSFTPKQLPIRSGRPRTSRLIAGKAATPGTASMPCIDLVNDVEQSRSWLRQIIKGMRPVGVRICQPSSTLVRFAEEYRASEPTEARLGREAELELNRRYFADDIRHLRHLIPCNVDGWLTTAQEAAVC